MLLSSGVDQDARKLEQETTKIAATGKQVDAIRMLERSLLLRLQAVPFDGTEACRVAEELIIKLNALSVKSFKNSEYQTAVEFLSKALRLTNRDAEPLTRHPAKLCSLRCTTLNNFACLERRRGRFAAAYAYIRESVRLSSDTPSPAILLNYSAILAQMGNSTEAIMTARRAIETLEMNNINTSTIIRERIGGATTKEEELASAHADYNSLIAIAYHNLAVALEPVNLTESIHMFKVGLELAHCQQGDNSATIKAIEHQLTRLCGANISLRSLSGVQGTKGELSNSSPRTAHFGAGSLGRIPLPAMNLNLGMLTSHSSGFTVSAAAASARSFSNSGVKSSSFIFSGHGCDLIHSSKLPGYILAEEEGKRKRIELNLQPPQHKTTHFSYANRSRSQIKTGQGKKPLFTSEEDVTSRTESSTARSKKLSHTPKPPSVNRRRTTINRQRLSTSSRDDVEIDEEVEFAGDLGNVLNIQSTMEYDKNKQGNAHSYSAGSNFMGLANAVFRNSKNIVQFMVSRLDIMLKNEAYFEKWYLAARKIECMFRRDAARRTRETWRNMRQEVFLAQLKEEETSAFVLQRIFRRLRTRGLIRENKERQEQLERKKEDRAVIRIQRQARAWINSNKTKKLQSINSTVKNAIEKLQHWWRLLNGWRLLWCMKTFRIHLIKQALQEEKRITAIKLIQRTWRGALVIKKISLIKGKRRSYLEWEKSRILNLNAMKIQQCYRSYYAYKMTKMMREERLRNAKKILYAQRELKAVIILQSFARGLIIRNKTDVVLKHLRTQLYHKRSARENCAARGIQRIMRGFLARLHYVRLCYVYRLFKEKSYWEQSAVLLQRVGMGYGLRIFLGEVKRKKFGNLAQGRARAEQKAALEKEKVRKIAEEKRQVEEKLACDRSLFASETERIKQCHFNETLSSFLFWRDLTRSLLKQMDVTFVAQRRARELLSKKELISRIQMTKAECEEGTAALNAVEARERTEILQRIAGKKKEYMRVDEEMSQFRKQLESELREERALTDASTTTRKMRMIAQPLSGLGQLNAKKRMMLAADEELEKIKMAIQTYPSRILSSMMIDKCQPPHPLPSTLVSADPYKFSHDSYLIEETQRRMAALNIQRVYRAHRARNWRHQKEQCLKSLIDCRILQEKELTDLCCIPGMQFSQWDYVEKKIQNRNIKFDESSSPADGTPLTKSPQRSHVNTSESKRRSDAAKRIQNIPKILRDKKKLLIRKGVIASALLGVFQREKEHEEEWQRHVTILGAYVRYGLSIRVIGLLSLRKICRLAKMVKSHHTASSRRAQKSDLSIKLDRQSELSERATAALAIQSALRTHLAHLKSDRLRQDALAKRRRLEKEVVEDCAARIVQRVLLITTAKRKKKNLEKERGNLRMLKTMENKL